MSYTVAIVGKPNVGKSTLFNRLIGKRKAIVHDQPGVTRDRNVYPIEMGGKSIALVDTGGLGSSGFSQVQDQINEQVKKAIDDCDVLLLVFDSLSGIDALDEEAAEFARKQNKPILLVANKMDPGSKRPRLNELYRFGFHHMVMISAEHNAGMFDLEEKLLELLPQRPEENKMETSMDRPAIRVALVGRPNVGKSSIINHLIHEERLAVSDVAGTTRDAVDVQVCFQDQEYVFVDTAGMRTKRKVQEDIEYYSVKRSIESIEKTDVVILVIDPHERLTTQDAKIAKLIVDRGKGFSIFVNKWDLVSGDGTKVRENFRKDVHAEFPFLQIADLYFGSAKTGKGLKHLFAQARLIVALMNKEYSEDELKDAYQMISKHHDGGFAGNKIEIKRLSVIRRDQQAPIFKIKCNKPQHVNSSFRKYWKNALHEIFSLRGLPISVVFRQK
ncbi:MAG: ribosome biogenesis GTPase Der [Bdellovibrionales bacterium]|nr:ribosome biogenesis GTPase Der [Bdellovibrionales bacterium]